MRLLSAHRPPACARSPIRRGASAPCCLARGLSGAVDGLRHHRQVEPGPAPGHDRGDRLVAHLAWGYKHPPLAAAIVWLWFSAFPVAAWSYYLLAVMPTLTLWIVWRLSADYLDHRKTRRRPGAADAGAVLQFPCAEVQCEHRAAAGLGGDHVWFLRSYATRSALYAALAGAGAAACMLGKYWSVFLLAGLVVAALIDKRRDRLFPLGAPWITVAVGLS